MYHAHARAVRNAGATFPENLWEDVFMEAPIWDMSMSKRKKRLRPEKVAQQIGLGWQVWKIVDGAVMDAFTNHPDYLTHKGSKGHTARRSIAKRVTGSVMSFLEQSKRGHR